MSHDTKEWYKVEKNDMKNLVNFNVSSSKSENFHFNVLLLSIAYKVSAEKYRKIISYDTEKRSNIEEKLTFCLKNDWGIWWTLTQVAESPKIWTLMGYFCRKYELFELKKYRGVVSWKMM